MLRRIALAVAVLYLQSAAPQTPVPTFRTGVDIVQLDVTVLDKDGRPQGSRFLSGGEGRGGQPAPQAHFALQPGTYRVEVRYSSGLKRAKDINVAGSHLRAVIDDQTPLVN